jgi:hypothetical protein
MKQYADKENDLSGVADCIAQWNYAYADAMLAARKQMNKSIKDMPALLSFSADPILKSHAQLVALTRRASLPDLRRCGT